MNKRNLYCYINAEIHPSADELAEVFCEMDEEEQAYFFNRIAEIIKEWDRPFCFQLSAINTHEALTDEGRKVMAQIGEYATNEPK